MKFKEYIIKWGNNYRKKKLCDFFIVFNKNSLITYLEQFFLPIPYKQQTKINLSIEENVNKL